jgi:hypothetical protein
LPVGAVYLDDPDACRGDVAGQAGAVTAGPFDADQAHSPESAQPAQQVGIAGRRGGELPDAEQPPTGSSAAATCVPAWVSTPPVTERASSTMVKAIPFSG